MIINLIDRVKHALRRDKALASSLQKILGFYPHNIEIYRVALAHKSQAYRNRKGKPLNNERLEFLGDAILEAVVSDIVYHRYERKREGFLTSTRSKIVQRSSLNKLAQDLGLDSLISATTQTKTPHNNIGGNAFEALVGAIYLDRGYRHCKWFVEKRIMGRLLDIDGVAQKEVNFKSKLLEWAQKNRIQADYRFDDTINEGTNTPVFNCSIVIEGIDAGRGKGFSKKESQQNAAREALARLRREPQFLDSIFRAKEGRTAMEAQEICALPQIEEIEEEIAQEKVRLASRHAKRAPGKGEKATPVAVKPEKGESKAADNKEKSVSPEVRSEEDAKKTPRQSGRKPKKKVVEVTTDADQPQPAEPQASSQEETVGRSPRRGRSRRKGDVTAELGEVSAQEREAIIRQAEEAAFGAE